MLITINLAKFQIGQEVKFGPSVTGIGQIGGKGKEPGRLGELAIPWHDLVDNPSLLSLLSWHTKISTFAGRDTELTQLEQWLNGSARVSVKFICGDGGAGKSRLAAEVAMNQRNKKWAAGFVNLNDSRSFPLEKKGTLLIIDYPEEYREDVMELLRDLTALEPPSKIRILFLTRQSIADWSEAVSISRAADLVDQIPIILSAICYKPAHEIYTSALDMASRALKNTEVLGLTEEALEAWLRLSPERHNRPLFIVAAAVHAVLYPEDEVVRYSSLEMMEAIVERELSRLKNIELDRGIRRNMLPRLLVMAAVAGRIPITQIDDLTNRAGLGRLSTDTVDLGELLGVTGFLFDKAVEAPKPDIIAAAFVYYVLGKEPAFAPEILWAAASPDLCASFDRLGRLAYDAEIVLEIRRNKLSDWLVEAVQKEKGRCLAVIDADTIYTPLGLTKVFVAGYRLCVEHESDDSTKAMFLNNLSIRLWESGDKRGAVEPIQQALDIYRRLAEANPAEFETKLAISLNNLSICLFDIRDKRGAADLLQQALNIFSRLVEADPVKFEPILADFLNNLSIYFSDIGDKRGAIETNQHALDIYHRLAEANPARFEPGLAMSLNTLSNCLADIGDKRGAIEPNQQALDIYRRLAEAAPALFEPHLAGCLNNLSICLAELGNVLDAIEPIQQAVEIRRRLAEADPARFEPDLAKSLHNLSNRLSEFGDKHGAINSIAEAVEIRYRLAKGDPARFEPDLANSLHDQSNRLSEFGDKHGAINSIAKAVEIRYRLAEIDPALFKPDLAKSLNLLLRLIEK